MSKNKFNAQWMQRHLTDPYVKKAQQQNFRSRAAFKLQGLDEDLKLVKPGMVVMDLGSTPGAWSQYLSRKLRVITPAGESKLHGKIIALDLLPMEPIAFVDFIQGDFREPAIQAELESILGGKQADLIVSDMAHNLTGIADVDAVRMADLIEIAINFCRKNLKPHGAFICKAFHGSGFSQTKKLFKDSFEIAKEIKPSASRSESSEVFLFGKKIKNID
jgi:23S rRNA (uridine2552-2'-O)-methyltransferase